MNVQLIVYELAEPVVGEQRPHGYTALIEALQEQPVCAQLTTSAWLIKTPRSAADMHDSLDRLLTPDDRLFVATLTGEAAWRNIERGYDWLEEQFGSCGPPERGVAH